MGYGHPLALRSRIIDAVKAGAAAREAARRFAVSPSSSINLVRRWRETGSCEPGQIGGQKKRKLAGWEEWLHAVMASEPDITLTELQKRLSRVRNGCRGKVSRSLSRPSTRRCARLVTAIKKRNGRRNEIAPTLRKSVSIGANGKPGSTRNVLSSSTKPAPKRT